MIPKYIITGMGRKNLYSAPQGKTGENQQQMHSPMPLNSQAYSMRAQIN